ncbi:MAG: hypothetical protein HY720_24670, partial [Planctomycetes bacterium]|nr:hypothetical protein [Planctomycetota bacterium]
ETARSPRPRRVYYIAVTDSAVANPPELLLDAIAETFETDAPTIRRCAGWTLFLVGQPTPLVDLLRRRLGDLDGQRVLPATLEAVADRTLAAAEIYLRDM